MSVGHYENLNPNIWSISCLKWEITDQFHKYLYGNTFNRYFYTDDNPLTYVQSTAKLDAMGHRWIAGLANYNFSYPL